MSGPREPKRVGADTILVCRNCDSAWGVEESEDGSCLNCGLGTVNPADIPAGIRIPVTGLPITCGGERIKRCCRCAGIWSTETYHVEQRFEGGRVGAVCRYCAHVDEEMSTWQSFCDIADAIDALMRKANGPAQRRLLASQIASTAEWFSVWRDTPKDDLPEQAAVIPAPRTPIARS